MILLDTDHLSVLKYPDTLRYDQLSRRMQSSRDKEFATTIVNMEEQMRGWLAEINRLRDVHAQVTVYDRLVGLFEFFSNWRILPFNETAAVQFAGLRQRKVRLGSSDLKIASIAIIHGLLLLSANLRDFRRVPGLKVENWLD